MNFNSYQNQIVQEEELFSKDDIFNAIFNDQYPNVVTKPFKKLGRYLGSIQVVFSLVPPSNLFETLHRSIITFNKKPVSKSLNIIRELPTWVIDLLWEEYEKYLKRWYDYLQENIKEFVEENIRSKVQWIVFKETDPKYFFKNDLTFEQRLWIFANHQNDKGDQIKLIQDVRESLLPWLNNELWSNMEKNKKGTKQNTDYERQRRQMIEGSFGKDELDEIK